MKKHETTATDENNVTDEALSTLMRLWQSGNKYSFLFCKELHVSIENKKVDGESLTEFYKMFNISKRHVERMKKVGQVFRKYRSDQMVAYSISHLTRLASLEETGKFIVNNKMKLVVDDLDRIKKYEARFNQRNYSCPADFISILKSVEKEDGAESQSFESDPGKGIEPNLGGKKGEDGADDEPSLSVHEKQVLKLKSKRQLVEESLTAIKRLIEVFMIDAREEQETVCQYLEGSIDLTVFESELDEYQKTITEIKLLLGKKNLKVDTEGKGSLSSARH